MERNLLLNVRTDTFPSELAQARIGPSSCGAQAMALTVGWDKMAATHITYQPNAQRGRHELKLTTGGMKRMLLHFSPSFTGRSLILLPDEHLAVEGA